MNNSLPVGLMACEQTPIFDQGVHGQGTPIIEIASAWLIGCHQEEGVSPHGWRLGLPSSPLRKSDRRALIVTRHFAVRTQGAVSEQDKKTVKE